MEKRFNLTEEPWIPIVDVGRVSLKEIFRNQRLKHLGGNAIQKISVLKLLLAIAQRAATPENDEEWKQLGVDGLSKKCFLYLDAHKDDFWLYGEKPFLQVPALLGYLDSEEYEESKLASLGTGNIPDVLSDNTSIVFQSQLEKTMSDAERAVFLLTHMNYSFAGKRINKDIKPLTKGYTDKSISAKPGPSLGNYVGYLSSHLVGNLILETIWINIFTEEHIRSMGIWREIGVPPWEEMPSGEACPVAQKLKFSFMATLCAVSRFMYLLEDRLIYCEGIQYPSHKQGWREPFICYNNKDQFLWLDVEKKPWRELSSLLSISETENNYFCAQITLLRKRAQYTLHKFGVWSGGLKVTAVSGDQSVKQMDSFIESVGYFTSESFEGYFSVKWPVEMSRLNSLAFILQESIYQYYYLSRKDQSQKRNQWADRLCKKAVNQFWQYCEQSFQDLIDQCFPGGDLLKIRKKIVSYLYQVYDNHCPRSSAKQLQLWAKNRPRIGTYLSELKSEKEDLVV